MRFSAAVIFHVSACCPGSIRLAWCLSNGPNMLSRTGPPAIKIRSIAARVIGLLFSHPVLNILNCITDKELKMGEEELPTRENPSPSKSAKKIPLPKKNYLQQVLAHLRTEISIDHADIPIIACCLVSGLCDSSAYNAWTCFVSMQTGEPFPNVIMACTSLTFIR